MPVLIIETADIDKLASLPGMITLIPELNKVKEVAGGCGCRAAQREAVYTEIKRALATLVGEPLIKVQSALGNDQLRLIYRDAQGNLQDRML